MKKKTSKGPTPKYTGRRLEVRMPDELRAAAEHLAARRGETLSEFVRYAVEQRVRALSILR